MDIAEGISIGLIASVFRRALFDGNELGLDLALGAGVPIEQYLILFQEAMTSLLENRYIDNLRYLELADFLKQRKNSIHDQLWYKERLDRVINAPPQSLFLK